MTSTHNSHRAYLILATLAMLLIASAKTMADDRPIAGVVVALGGKWVDAVNDQELVAGGVVHAGAKIGRARPNKSDLIVLYLLDGTTIERICATVACGTQIHIPNSELESSDAPAQELLDFLDRLMSPEEVEDVPAALISRRGEGDPAAFHESHQAVAFDLSQWLMVELNDTGGVRAQSVSVKTGRGYIYTTLSFIERDVGTEGRTPGDCKRMLELARTVLDSQSDNDGSQHLRDRIIDFTRACLMPVEPRVQGPH